MNKEHLVQQLEGLAERSNLRREMLLNLALDRSKAKRWLTYSAGILALVSAGTTATILAKLLGHDLFQYVAAICALAASIISFTSASYKEEEIQYIFKGSNQYLALRSKILEVMLLVHITNEELHRNFSELMNEYVKQDATYSNFFKRCKPAKDAFHDLPQFSK